MHRLPRTPRTLVTLTFASLSIACEPEPGKPDTTDARDSSADAAKDSVAEAEAEAEDIDVVEPDTAKPTDDTRSEDALEASDDSDDTEDTNDADDAGDPPAPASMASVRGSVRVTVLGRTIAPRGLSVWLQRKDAAGTTAKASTDLFGDWLLSGTSVVKGEYVVCSGGAGLDDRCDEAPFTLTPGWDQVVAPRHTRAAPPDTVAGRVTLADGTPCVWRFPLHGIAVDTALSAPASRTALAKANASGEFLLFGASEATLAVNASCEASAADVVAKTGEWTEIVFANHPPHIRGLVPRTVLGPVARSVIGIKMGIDAAAVDPDGDPLAASWASNTGKVALTGMAVTWTPTEEAPSLEVVVGDGHGGYDLEPLRLAFTEPPAPSGIVRDPEGHAVVGASLRQGDAVATTNDVGAFELADWRGDVPLVISAPGFVDRVVAADHRPVSLPIDLVPCEVRSFDAKTGAKLAHATPGALTVTIPAGAVMEAAGNPVDAVMTACLAVLETGGDAVDFPLGVGVDGVADGKPARVISPTRVAWVDLRTPDGKRAALRPGKSMSVAMTLTPAEAGAVGAGFATFEATEGIWRDTGAPNLQGSQLVVDIAGPGAVTTAASEDFGCIRLWLGGLQNQGRYALRWRAWGAPLGPAITVPITTGLDLLGPLPANRDIKVEVLDLDTPHHTPIAEWGRIIPSGNINGVQPVLAQGARLPYELCGGDLVVPAPEPVTGVDLLGRFRLDDGVTSDGQTVTVSQLVAAYYTTTDPLQRRTQLAGWWEHNGFWDENGPFLFTEEALSNRESAPDIVRHAARRTFNFGGGLTTSVHLGLFPDYPSAAHFYDLTTSEAPEEPPVTLAVEHRAATNTEPARVVFYAFIGNNRVTHIDLDGSGLKPVPALCMNCHGGNQLDANLLADHVALDGTWPSESVGARLIPFALDTFQFYDRQRLGVGLPTWDALYGRASQEAGFRAINAAMRPFLTPAATALVNGAYGGLATAPTLPANAYDDTWVPPGTGAIGWDDDPTLYRAIVAPLCRSCHLQAGPDFASRDDFRGIASLVEEDICMNRSMPHSRSLSHRFWNATNPYLPALLQQSMQGVPGWTGMACDPP